MDSRSIFGGNPLSVVLRLAVISIAVGVVLSALGINLRNFFERLNDLARSFYDLGFGAVEWALQYMLLGAIVVLPLWLLLRIMSGVSKRNSGA